MVKCFAAAAERNREPILAVLRRLLPASARILEIGGGTGQHAAFFTENMPSWLWQSTDASEACVDSITAFSEEAARPGFPKPLRLDVRTDPWPGGPFDALFTANVIHISPWPVAEAIIGGAARVLTDAGALIFYGPFRFDGQFTAPSNAAFDARLRHDDPEWGVRDVADLRATARRHGLLEPEVVEMPANNHILVLRRAGLPRA